MGLPRPRVRAARKPYLGAGEGLGPPGLEESGGSTLPSVGRNHDRYLSTRMKYAQSEVRMWRAPGSGWKSKSALVCGSGCRPGCGLQWPQGSNQCTRALGHGPHPRGRTTSTLGSTRRKVPTTGGLTRPPSPFQHASFLPCPCAQQALPTGSPPNHHSRCPGHPTWPVKCAHRPVILSEDGLKSKGWRRRQRKSRRNEAGREKQ